MQRWARITGWACLLLPLPSVAWRVAMLAGVDLGFAEADLFREQAGGPGYVLALNLVEVAVGLACTGLWLPWGERLARWVPLLGGAAIPRILPTLIAGAGNLLMYVVWGRLLAQFVPAWLGVRPAWTPDHAMDGLERTLLFACYIPFLVWPLAITATIIGYWRRRRPAAA